MKFIIILLSLFLINSCAINQNKKVELKKELTEILQSDQELRELFTPNITTERKTEILSKYKISQEDFNKKNWKITEENDSLNLRKIEKIIKKYGYPRKALVGEKQNTAVWYVIQHSKLSTIEKYFPLMEKANKNGDLKDTHIAMMKDRMLMYQGKEQIYGTQGAGRFFINSETKKEEWTNFIWPIKSWEEVNQLRKSVGFNETIEEYAKSLEMDISKKYTIEEIESLTKK